MQESDPLEVPPRSGPSAAEWAKEKLKGADLVAVGVNFVVGALLIGGVVGALLSQDGSNAAPSPDVNAALAAQDEAKGNQTAASPGDESVGEGSSHKDPKVRERDEDK